MKVGRAALSGTVALALTAGTVALSRIPTAFSLPDDALLRLSWKMKGITAQACRTRTPEELEKLPVHMRDPRACIGHIASYHLGVRVDGVLALDDTVAPAGARGDRPLTLLRDLPLKPGSHRVAVAFDAILPDTVPPPEEGIRSLSWSGTVVVGSRAVALITLGDEGRALEYRTEED